jgi:hypothetical protein
MLNSNLESSQTLPTDPQVKTKRFLLILDSILVVFSLLFIGWILMIQTQFSYLFFNFYVILSCLHRHVKTGKLSRLLLLLSIACSIAWARLTLF